MKAIQVEKPGQLNIVELEKPVIEKGDEVIVKIKNVGICGSDVHIYHGSNPFTSYPRVIGHEVSGIVEQVGEAVTSLAPGDLVALEPITYCGECYACRNGQPNVCDSLEVFGVHRDGGMAEYLKADENNWHRVPGNVSEEAAALMEPMTIGAQATYRGEVREGDTVFVIGAGPTGIACLLQAKQRGAKVFISDFNQNRLDYAKSIGADAIIQPNEVDAEEEINRLTNGELANVVIDAVGLPQTFQQAVELASIAGRVVTLGFNEQPSSIPSLLLTKKELKVAGSRLQTHQFPKVIDQVGRGEIDPTQIISQRYSMDQIHDAFELLENNPEAVRKIVLTF
ncbi:alcohol dehydrogenase [Salinicoccus sediminis]|uniref:Alcohol dehydrogenase n=1 Tax=Salinicoccus sediminis TaxID=1432562 RepID=A0A0M2SMV9_9STAP|nr:zinc-binding alcohol dehydrogenase family protein [Salinicoccus sediminis]KKK34991.1 alcohol dehydrogenase [Salinicoccus sediminis]